MTAVVLMAAILHGIQILLSGATEGEGDGGRTVGRRWLKRWVESEEGERTRGATGILGY